MLHIQSGNLKEGRAKEYQAWVSKNEGLLKEHAPPGWTYRGTYFYVLGFGRYHVAIIWECSRYGDFDASREHNDETWTRLNEEASDFFTPDPGEAMLLREISDTKIIEPPKSEE
jgi:hypothetical protein